MTQSIQNYSTNTLMADACYIDFSASRTTVQIISDLTDIGFTPAQAESFLSQYSVSFHYPDDSTGLSFTIFKDNATNKLTLAIRGTEGVVDLVEDGILATTGLAQNQAVLIAA